MSTDYDDDDFEYLECTCEDDDEESWKHCAIHGLEQHR